MGCVLSVKKVSRHVTRPPGQPIFLWRRHGQDRNHLAGCEIITDRMIGMGKKLCAVGQPTGWHGVRSTPYAMQGLQYMTTRVQTSYKLRSQRYRADPLFRPSACQP